MIAARVEDFPDPVGPVTNTMPVRNSVIAANSCGSFNAAKVGIAPGMTRITMAQLPRCMKTLTLKRALPGKPLRDVARTLLSESVQSVLVGTNQVRSNSLGVIGGQYRQPLNAHRQQTSVLFNNGRPAGRKDQIADLRCGAQHRTQQRRCGWRRFGGSRRGSANTGRRSLLLRVRDGLPLDYCMRRGW